MSVLTVSEARAALPELLTRVGHGEEITITRHGQAVAVVVRPDKLRSRQAESALAESARVTELLKTAKETPLPGSSGVTERRAEEMIREIRAGRRGRV